MLLWYCGNFERTPQSTVNQHFVRKKLERVSFCFIRKGSYMYHAGLGKFVNDNYIKKITTKNKINKNIIFGYVKDNIYYELNEIVEDIDAYINKLETEGCVVYFVKKKKISRRNSNTGQQRE